MGFDPAYAINVVAVLAIGVVEVGADCVRMLYVEYTASGRMPPGTIFPQIKRGAKGSAAAIAGRCSLSFYYHKAFESVVAQTAWESLPKDRVQRVADRSGVGG